MYAKIRFICSKEKLLVVFTISPTYNLSRKPPDIYCIVITIILHKICIDINYSNKCLYDINIALVVIMITYK